MNGVPEQDYRMMKQRAEAAEARAAELERTVEVQQRQIAELQDRVWQLEANIPNYDDGVHISDDRGNEWEKEYYLRGQHR